jgi:hypothetical protein
MVHLGLKKPNKQMDYNVQFGLNFSSTFTILFQKSVLLKKIHAITKAHLSRPERNKINQGALPSQVVSSL